MGTRVRTAWVLAGCVLIGLTVWALHLRRGVVVVVHNSGLHAIVDVEAELGGGRAQLGDIAAGGSASGRLIPRADSDVIIAFRDGDQKRQTVQLNVYVTGGYRGRIDAHINDGKLERKTDRLDVGLY